MKRTTVLLLAGFILLISAQVLAADESEYYYTNVPIYKIYSHTEGYICAYKVGSTELATAYLPMRWFTPGGKGDIDFGYGALFPYMSVYYKDGKFDHVRLHLNGDTRDARWGIIQQGADVKLFFDGVEELKIRF